MTFWQSIQFWLAKAALGLVFLVVLLALIFACALFDTYILEPRRKKKRE